MLSNRFGEGGGTYSCPIAIANAATDWESNYWNVGSASVFYISVLTYMYTNADSPDEYVAEKENNCGSIYCDVSSQFPNLVQGTLMIHAMATNFAGGIGSNPPPFTVNGTYQYWTNATVISNTPYYSPLLATNEPTIGGCCDYDDETLGSECRVGGSSMRILECSSPNSRRILTTSSAASAGARPAAHREAVAVVLPASR